MNINWLEKYKSDDLNIYDNNVENINKIDNLILNKINSIIIKGDSGIGKNNIINLLAKKHNYLIKKYKLNDKKLISLENFYLNNISKKKVFLIINKIDYITTINEKKNIQNLNKLSNQKNNNIILIFFIEKSITKIVKEINKNAVLIELNNPSNKLLLSILNKIIINEKILLPKKFHEIIISLCQYDIRKLILILKDIKYTFEEKMINKNDLELYLKFTNKKIKNYNINDTTKIIINSYNYEDSIRYYNNDKVILPLMIYENFLNKLQYKKNINDLLSTINKISNLISWGDIIETNIYTDQNWYLQNIHGFITIVSTSYLINKYDNNKYNLTINFSNDLNKTSLKNINKKNYNNIKNIINFSIDEILIINSIFTFFLKENNIDSIIKYLKEYKINFKIFDMIIKINKINKYVISNIHKKIMLSNLKIS